MKNINFILLAITLTTLAGCCTPLSDEELASSSIKRS